MTFAPLLFLSCGVLPSGFRPSLHRRSVLVHARGLLVLLIFSLLRPFRARHRLSRLLGLQFRQVMSDVLPGGVNQGAINVQSQNASGSVHLSDIKGQMAQVASQIQNVLPLKPLSTQEVHAWVFTPAGVAIAVIFIIIPVLKLLLRLIIVLLLMMMVMLATSRTGFGPAPRRVKGLRLP